MHLLVPRDHLVLAYQLVQLTLWRPLVQVVQIVQLDHVVLVRPLVLVPHVRLVVLVDHVHLRRHAAQMVLAHPLDQCRLADLTIKAFKLVQHESLCKKI